LVNQGTQLQKDIAELKDTSTTSQDGQNWSEGFDDLSQLQSELTSIRKRLDLLEKEKKKVAASLRTAEPATADLLDSSPEELEQWAETYLPNSPEVRRFKELVRTHGDWESRFGRVNDFETALITASQVVAGTCVGVAAIRGLADIEFDLCIVDEASKATPTETLVPISRSRRWILVGDTKQLPPFVDDGLRDKSLLEENTLTEAALTETLFSRLQDYLPEICTAALSMQHRMVPAIGDLIGECFYPGQLESAPKEWDTTFQHLLPRPVVWYTTTKLLNRHEIPTGSNSFSNPLEARVISDLLVRMNGIAESTNGRRSVLVITGYAEQKQSLDRSLAPLLPKMTALHVECNTVDAVQGREADVAIYSVTRSNASGRLGFLRETRRLNVALSRGRQYLVVVGDHYFCRTATGENPFKRVVEYVESHSSSCALREYKN
jgi:superfamily I DNA and/or RNA helicase